MVFLFKKIYNTNVVCNHKKYLNNKNISGSLNNNYSRLVFCFSFIFIIFLSFFFYNPKTVLASETNGTIDSTYKYAWGENIGWINFGCDNCNVAITDSALSGYAWSSQYGWINLSPNQGGNTGVQNTSEGVLSGYAWSSNLGWINFSGVTINTSGEFLGYATVKSDSSQINFNCANASSCGSADFKVKTDWRPASVRRVAGGGGGGGGGIHYGCKDPKAINYEYFATSNPALCLYATIPPVITPPPTTPTLPPTTPTVTPPQTLNPVISFFGKLLDLFRKEKGPTEPTSVVIQIPKNAPLAFGDKWNILPVKAINTFVFAPLPYDVRMLALKFPEIGKTLKSVGVNRFTDMNKLTGTNFSLEGLAELDKTLGNIGMERLADLNLSKINNVTLNIPGFPNMNPEMIANLGTGKISLIKGLPVSDFPLIAKKNLPAEFVFARASGGLVDLNVVLSIGDKGEVSQQISSLPGKTLRLVVKPISKARSVTGYFVFKSATPKIVRNEISRESLSASALFSMKGLVEKNPEPISVENKLVLSSFEYTDPDHDGIYTAEVMTPVVPGEYEVITVIEYIDPTLGTRQMRMITVIDPEGYVFEKNNGKETRIPSAIVSLYQLNTTTKKYELWPAKDYQQENPQVTDVRGTYSFLVPEGSYYFDVEAPGYNSYQGKVFVVSEGAGIHQNIELESGRGFLEKIDWKTVLLIAVFILLVYNLYRNSLREKLFKFIKKNDS